MKIQEMYRWVEHTGELELEIEAASEREVFEQGFAAMRELLACEREGSLPPREVSLAGSDLAVLLADWLGELAFLAETAGLVPDRLTSIELASGHLQATVAGHAGRPPHLVKGATYHRLSFERREGGWRATVVLDV